MRVELRDIGLPWTLFLMGITMIYQIVSVNVKKPRKNNNNFHQIETFLLFVPFIKEFDRAGEGVDLMGKIKRPL